MVFAKKKMNPLLKAFLINAFFFILALVFCDQKYEVSDDFMIDAVLSGAYGDTYNPVMLFSNTLLGYFLVILYKLIPHGSIYFFYLLFSAFFCLTCITYTIIKKNDSILGILISFILVSFFSDDLYISLTFTKVSVLQLCTGGLLILFAFEHHNCRKNHFYYFLFVGTFLIFLGSFLRINCVPIAFGFLFILFLHFALNNKRNDSVKKLFLICLSLVVMIYVFYHSDRFMKLSVSNNNGYVAINPYIDKIENRYKFDYETMKPVYDQLHFSENDFQMLYLWNFVDQDIFTQEKISIIGDAMESEVYLHTKTPAFCFNKLRSKNYYLYPSLWGLLILSLLVFIYNKQKWPYIFSIILLCFVFLYYCVYTGKLPYRVEYSIFMCASISIAFLSKINSVPQKSGFFYLICIFLLIFKTPIYLPDKAYLYMNDSDYYDYVSEIMTQDSKLCYGRYTINLNHRRFLGNLIDTMEQDQEHYYLVAFNPFIQMLYYNYKPWERIPIGYLRDSYNYVGGVNYKLKYSDDALVANGVDPSNPNKSLIDNNQLIWVELFPDYEFTYLKEHYCDTLNAHYLGSVDYADLWQFTSH